MALQGAPTMQRLIKNPTGSLLKMPTYTRAVTHRHISTNHHSAALSAAPSLPKYTTRGVHTRPCRQGRKQVVVHASWGAPVEFQKARVLKNTQAAPGLHSLLLDVGQALAAGYTKPGQFIQAKVGADSKPGFFAIASPPDVNNSGVMEFLIKRVPGVAADALCGLAAGDEVQVSAVQGKGFPIENIPAADYPTLLMVATGSGIAPIKAAIESGVLELRQRRDVRLYYGARCAEAMAYKDLLPAWSALGIKVVPVFSDGDGSGGGSDGKGTAKYVQDAIRADGSLPDPLKTGVLLCGQRDMVGAVVDQLRPQGVDHLLLNF